MRMKKRSRFPLPWIPCQYIKNPSPNSGDTLERIFVSVSPWEAKTGSPASVPALFTVPVLCEIALGYVFVIGSSIPFAYTAFKKLQRDIVLETVFLDLF